MSKRLLVGLGLCSVVGPRLDQDTDERKYLVIKHHRHKLTDGHMIGTKEQKIDKIKLYLTSLSQKNSNTSAKCYLPTQH